MKPDIAKVCPKCRSKNIFLWMGTQAGVIYECKDCGYHGPFIVEEYRLSKTTPPPEDICRQSLQQFWAENLRGK